VVCDTGEKLSEVSGNTFPMPRETKTSAVRRAPNRSQAQEAYGGNNGVHCLLHSLFPFVFRTCLHFAIRTRSRRGHALALVWPAVLRRVQRLKSIGHHDCLAVSAECRAQSCNLSWSGSLSMGFVCTSPAQQVGRRKSVNCWESPRDQTTLPKNAKCTKVQIHLVVLATSREPVHLAQMSDSLLF